MTGSYFIPRLLIALLVPLTIASFGPTQSHPELGTDVGPLVKSKKSEVYRSNDVKMQVALSEAMKQKPVTKLQAYRRGQKVHFKRRDE